MKDVRSEGEHEVNEGRRVAPPAASTRVTRGVGAPGVTVGTLFRVYRGPSAQGPVMAQVMPLPGVASPKM